MEDVLASGSVIAGRFRLLRLLGRGGMGSVWEAFHLALETEVAIKFLDPKWSGSADVRWRFAQEATSAARIHSPHVVNILDFGFTERGRAFIVMELLRGEDLGQRLDRTSRLDVTETAELIAQACRGLGKAHEIDIVHRDLKPENLFLLADQAGFFVKLLDFGVAKALGSDSETNRTDTGQILGTPLYMSPEQALGRVIDARSDLYSLSVVAFRCLTGRPPFIEKHVGELLVALSTQQPPAPSTLQPGLPAALDLWFASMFLKDPSARCSQTARELSESFRAACNGVCPAPSDTARVSVSALRDMAAPTLPESDAGRASEPGTKHATDAGVSSALPSSVPPPARAQRPPRWLLAGGAAAVLAAVVALGFWTQRSAPTGAARAELTQGEASLRPGPAQRLVALRLSASPPAATLYLDGERLAANPFAGQRSFDTAVHHLRVEAPGYVALDRDIVLDRDVELAFALSPPPAALPPPAPPAEATSAPGSAGSPHTPPARRAASKASTRRPGDAASAGTPEPRAGTPPPAAPADGKPPPPRKRPLELDRSSPWGQP